MNSSYYVGIFLMKVGTIQDMVVTVNYDKKKGFTNNLNMMSENMKRNIRNKTSLLEPG